MYSGVENAQQRVISVSIDNEWKIDKRQSREKRSFFQAQEGEKDSNEGLGKDGNPVKKHVEEAQSPSKPCESPPSRPFWHR